MITGYQASERLDMQEKKQAIPLIFDYADMRLRLPVRRPDDPFMEAAGIGFHLSRLL